MNYIDGVKRIKNRELQPIVLISGEENYLKEDLLERIKKQYVDQSLEDFNLDIIEGKAVLFNDLYEICETLPFMDKKRIVVVENLPMDRNSVSKINDFLEQLLNYFKTFPEFTFLVLVSVGKAYKGKFLKNAIKYMDHFEVSKLNQRELENFIKKSFNKSSIKIDQKGLKYFIENTMYLESEMKVTLYDVENEIIKLKNLNKSELTLLDIDQVLISSFESNIFRLTDAIGEKKRKNVLETYFRLMKSNSDPFHVFYMIIRQLRNLLYIKWAALNRIPLGEAKKSIGISEYEYKKLQGYLKNWSVDALQRGLHTAYEIEVQLKSTGADSEELFKNFIVKILL